MNLFSFIGLIYKWTALYVEQQFPKVVYETLLMRKIPQFWYRNEDKKSVTVLDQTEFKAKV